MGITVMPPDVNVSDTNFTVTAEHVIRYGLSAIKNVGLGAIESILAARKEKGEFTSLRDFCSRVDLHSCNKKVMEHLIKGGAFDCFGANRLQLLAIVDDTVSAAQTMNKEKLNGQISMFEIVEANELDLAWVKLHDEYPAIPEPSPKERLAMEKEALGLFISGHPLEEYNAVLKLFPKLAVLNELNGMSDEEPVVAAGMISSFKPIFTKAGKPMSFFMLEDLLSGVEVVVFSAIHEKAKEYLENDRIVLVHGRISHKEDEDAKILADKIVLLPQEARQVLIRCTENEGLNRLLALKELLRDACGTMPVYLTFPECRKKVLLAENYWLYDNETQLREIEKLFGSEAVTVQIAG